MAKGISTHKQIKKLNEKAKTRKALEDVQRAPKEVYHPLSKKKFTGNVNSYPWNDLASWPGFNHFGGRVKKALGKKYKALV